MILLALRMILNLKKHYMPPLLLMLSAILVLVLAMDPVRAQTCIADKQDFDFMQTSPTKFHHGRSEDVKSVYQRLLKRIGDPAIYGGTSLFYATSDGSAFSQAYCQQGKCTGTDILNGLNKCSVMNNVGCYPVAAIYDQKLYCLLEPAVNEYQGDKPFDPFE